MEVAKCKTPTRTSNSFVNEAERDYHWREMCINTCSSRNCTLKRTGKIYRNAGATTHGVSEETVDGMSMEKIATIIEALRYERYRWTPARRTHIPKKNGKMRPLGVPTWSDKLLQEAIRQILEAYYEPQFNDHSHGFRPGRGCHTALQEIHYTWQGTTWLHQPPAKADRRGSDPDRSGSPEGTDHAGASHCPDRRSRARMPGYRRRLDGGVPMNPSILSNVELDNIAILQDRRGPEFKRTSTERFDGGDIPALGRHRPRRRLRRVHGSRGETEARQDLAGNRLGRRCRHRRRCDGVDRLHPRRRTLH